MYRQGKKGVRDGDPKGWEGTFHSSSTFSSKPNSPQLIKIILLPAIMKEGIGCILPESTKSSIWFCDQMHYILCEDTDPNLKCRKSKQTWWVQYHSTIPGSTYLLSPISNSFTSLLWQQVLQYPRLSCNRLWKFRNTLISKQLKYRDCCLNFASYPISHLLFRTRLEMKTSSE
jgi:hypothetical protein